MNHLVRYDAMCQAIAAAYEVDEVKDIRDRARALEMYARMADNTEAETQACEIRLRAERKAGQLLREMDKAKGGRPPQNPSHDVRGYKTLADMGISYKQSADWQKLADIPDERFEQFMAERHATTTGMIAAAHPMAVSPVSEDALWLWGRLRDWEREPMGMLGRDPAEYMATMTDDMVDDVVRLAPLIIAWLRRIGETDEARRRRSEAQADH